MHPVAALASLYNVFDAGLTSSPVVTVPGYTGGPRGWVQRLL